MSREEKLATFGELSKLPNVKTGTCYADSCNTARLLLDHPHGGLWHILGPDRVQGFYRLEARIRLDQWETTRHEICLHESQFQRIP
jgi:hypothetical protein